MSLGSWALIDIETTGINPGSDEIIDIGYIQFSGTKLVRKYSSLVRPSHEVSPYISKLTGITNLQLSKAPIWSSVEVELLELEGHNLIAHNASFEESFLARYFEKEKKIVERETYHDSIYYLALLNPSFNSLNLEHFITHYGISDKEEHRGLADSIDLLKVLILNTYIVHKNKDFSFKLLNVFQNFSDEFWFKDFFQLNEEELISLGDQIDFDVLGYYSKFHEKNNLNSNSQKSEFISWENLNFDSENIKSILKSENLIKQWIPNYLLRASQEALALRVGQSFKNQIHALIQAPTGTGKTFGYLIPSLLFALNEKENCLISTGTKTLQEQAMSKDIPRILSLLGLNERMKVVRLVGSNNHLCELIFREDSDENNLLQDFGEKFTKAYLEIFFYYNSIQPTELQLTRDQIPFVLKKKLVQLSEKEQAISVDYKVCVGTACPFVGKCSYIQGLREAKEANVIVGNHALMLNWPRSFPRPSHIVVDEAHRIETEATNAYSIEIVQSQFEMFPKALSQGMGALIYLISQSERFDQENIIEKLRLETNSQLTMFRDHSETLPSLVESFFKKLPNYSPLYSNELPFPTKNSLKDSLSTAILNHLESLAFISSSLFSIYKPYIDSIELEDFKEDINKLKAKAVFESAMSQLDKINSSLEHVLKADSMWSDVLLFTESAGFKILSSPIDVGRLIHDNLLETSSSVVFTSATLANASGDSGVQSVEWMSGYTYLKPEKRFKKPLFLDAVFDYKNNSKVFLASDVKSISSPLFVTELMEKVGPILKKINGRTLFLFSSRARFDQAVDYLLREIDKEIPVFVQGLGKNVIEEFKKAPSGILIGMESFGEGIDIPGEKLQFVVIDKIPDVRQDLVIQKRREFFDSKFGNEFHDYFLAHRTRSLHQKFGRLIRTETDQGVILVVDSRVSRWKRGTLVEFKKQMEPYEILFENLQTSISEIEKYFSNLGMAN